MSDAAPCTSLRLTSGTTQTHGHGKTRTSRDWRLFQEGSHKPVHAWIAKLGPDHLDIDGECPNCARQKRISVSSHPSSDRETGWPDSWLAGWEVRASI